MRKPMRKTVRKKKTELRIKNDEAIRVHPYLLGRIPLKDPEISAEVAKILATPGLIPEFPTKSLKEVVDSELISFYIGYTSRDEIEYTGFLTTRGHPNTKERPTPVLTEQDKTDKEKRNPLRLAEMKRDGKYT
jgi:hypothetical protein